jgi:hypothetical protein
MKAVDVQIVNRRGDVGDGRREINKAQLEIAKCRWRIQVSGEPEWTVYCLVDTVELQLPMEEATEPGCGCRQTVTVPTTGGHLLLLIRPGVDILFGGEPKGRLGPAGSDRQTEATSRFLPVQSPFNELLRTLCWQVPWTLTDVDGVPRLGC